MLVIIDCTSFKKTQINILVSLKSVIQFDGLDLIIFKFIPVVLDVYDQLSHHFSEERYRPWPRVRQFLEQLEPGSLVCDAGTILIPIH